MAEDDTDSRGAEFLHLCVGLVGSGRLCLVWVAFRPNRSPLALLPFLVALHSRSWFWSRWPIADVDRLVDLKTEASSNLIRLIFRRPHITTTSAAAIT